jgi:hypothetical protein
MTSPESTMRTDHRPGSNLLCWPLASSQYASETCNWSPDGHRCGPGQRFLHQLGIDHGRSPASTDPTDNWHGFRHEDDGNSTWGLIQARTSNPVNERLFNGGFTFTGG